MKIITILGSPRRKGNTAKLLSMFEDKIQKGHDFERINITEHKVNGCIGCYKCKETNCEPGCVQKDDAIAIFEKMIKADAIVYASPLYCWSFTSQIKPLIDRHFCLVSGEGTPDYNSLIRGKRAALLVTCAGPIEKNCDAIKSIFKGFTEYLNLDAKGDYILPFCTTPEAIGDEGDALSEKLADGIAK
jgi:multimeric flavodoxin WrbA